MSTITCCITALIFIIVAFSTHHFQNESDIMDATEGVDDMAQEVNLSVRTVAQLSKSTKVCFLTMLFIFRILYMYLH